MPLVGARLPRQRRLSGPPSRSALVGAHRMKEGSSTSGLTASDSYSPSAKIEGRAFVPFVSLVFKKKT